MNFREATEFDLPSLLKLAKEFHYAAHFKRISPFEDSTPSWAKWFDECRELDNALCLIAEGEDGPTGFITAIVTPFFWNRHERVGQEVTLWVSDKYRNQGIATALLGLACDWARENHATVFQAGSSVRLSPKTMGKFLRKNGFEMEERMYTRSL